MKHLLFICLSLVLILFTLTECKKNDDVQPQNPPADTTDTGNNGGTDYNKADTTVSLQNGRITIDIPAGAMKEGTKMSIGSSNVKFIDTAHQLHQFELKPEGTTFKKPVTLTFHYDTTWLKGNSPWNIGIAYKDDKDGNWYPAVNGDVDTVNHTISIKTRHFSHWSIYSCFHLYMKADGQLSEDFSKTIEMEPQGDIGLLFMTMSEPPLWKQDPDKDKGFTHTFGGLVAPLGLPAIPEESDFKFIAPDAWFVNGIRNGDNQVGTIGPVPAAHAKNLFEFATPQKVPGDGDIAISAQINTISHGSIILIQGVQLVSYGYMPSGNIISETYSSNEASSFITHTTVNNYKNITTTQVSTVVTGGGVTVTTKAVDNYNGYVTNMTSTPDVSLMIKSYNQLRKAIDETPYVTKTDTSFTVHPFKYSFPDGVAKGDTLYLEGDITTYIDYIADPPGGGSMHSHYVLKSYNRNAVVEGYDSLKTKAGKFRCLIFSFDHVAADTNYITPSAPGTVIKKETVFHTTEWLARGIGLVKSVSHDPTNNTDAIVTLNAIERKQH